VEDKMQRKVFVVIFLILILATFFYGLSQEQSTALKNPPSLYPEPGPGDLAIVKELQETNRLLSEQVQILNEQNRLLRQYLAKQEAPVKQ
jgi:hypothetical protein